MGYMCGRRLEGVEFYLWDSFVWLDFGVIGEGNRRGF